MDVLTLHDAFKRLEDIEDKIEVNIPKKERKITESYKESDDVKNILDTLGIDASNRTLKNKEQNDKLVSQYRYLCKKYPNASICLAEGYTPKNGTILGESLDLLAVKKEEVVKESVSIKKVGVIKESLKEDEEGDLEGEATVVSGEDEEFTDDIYFKYSPSKGTVEIVDYRDVDFEDDEEEVVKEMLCKSLKESDDDVKPFTYSQVFQELKTSTNGFKQSDGTFTYCFEEESKHALEALKKKGYNVDMHSEDDKISPTKMKYVVDFSKTKQFESLSEDYNCKEYKGLQLCIDNDNVESAYEHGNCKFTVIIKDGEKEIASVDGGFKAARDYIDKNNLGVKYIIKIVDKTPEQSKYGYSYVGYATENYIKFVDEFKDSGKSSINVANTFSEDIKDAYKFNTKEEASKYITTDDKELWSILTDVESYDGDYTVDDLLSKINLYIKKISHNVESLEEENGKKDCKIKYTLKKSKNDYGEYVVKCYKDGKFDEEGSYYSDDWDDAVATFKDMSKRANLNVRNASNGFIAECKTITEAPDKYGIPTDDELKQEYHAKKAQAIRDRQKAYEDEMVDKEKGLPESTYCVVKSKEAFNKGVSVRVLFKGTYEECLEWLKEENKSFDNKYFDRVEIKVTPIKSRVVEVEVDTPEGGKEKVKKRKKRSDFFKIVNQNTDKREYYSIVKDTGDFNETLKEDLESVEYKGFTLEPLEIKSIEFGGKSMPGFTKYIIKKGEKLLPDKVYELYRKDHKLETIDDYKDLIDSIQVKEAKESTRKEQRGMTKHRGRKITEGITVDLMQEDEVEEGKKELEKKDERKEQAEKIVDVDANTIDELKDSYVGNAILQCPVCRTLIYKKPDALKKDEEDNIYNKEETCPHCGSLDGYVLVGQVATYDTPFEKDEETTTGSPDEEEIKEFAREDPAEENALNDVETELNELEFESLDKTSFDKLINDYLVENYSNVKNYTSTKSYTDKNQLFVEGVIEYTNKKKKDTKFVFEGVSRKNNKYRFKGINEAISKDKAFTLLSKVNEGTLNCNILRYKYKPLNESIDVRGSVCYRKGR